MLKDRLEQLVEQIDKEIQETGTVTVGGVPCFKNSLKKDNKYAGLCHGAVEKLKELAPDIEFIATSFEVSGGSVWQRGRHVVAEVRSDEGYYCVDPTIWQYIPSVARVYGPKETYPLKVVSGSISRKKM